MSFDFLDGFRDEPAPSAPAVISRAEAPTFPCQRCAGTGRYAGFRSHQAETKCFTCDGRGWFRKPYADAMRERANRKQGRATALADRLGAFDEANPGLRAWLSAQAWSTFLVDMSETLATRGALSENQLRAVLSTRAKSEARRAERVEARTSEVDLSAIRAMFATAESRALEMRGSTGKRLRYRAAGMVLSPAKESSANAGAIYVKTTDGTYLGKVAGTRFQATREATEEHKATLARVAADPAGEARRYGQETGVCCICSRTLTDPDSIAAGIGPICAEGWAF